MTLRKFRLLLYIILKENHEYDFVKIGCDNIIPEIEMSTIANANIMNKHVHWNEYALDLSGIERGIYFLKFNDVSREIVLRKTVKH